MSDSSLNISFGIRPKRSYGDFSGRTIGKRVAKQVKKMYPACPNGIIGETRIGDTIATVTINPNNFTLEVEPHYLRDEVLKRLSTTFHDGKKLRHKHSKPRPDHTKVRNRFDKYDTRSGIRLNTEF